MRALRLWAARIASRQEPRPSRLPGAFGAALAVESWPGVRGVPLHMDSAARRVHYHGLQGLRQHCFPAFGRHPSAACACKSVETGVQSSIVRFT